MERNVITIRRRGDATPEMIGRHTFARGSRTSSVTDFAVPVVEMLVASSPARGGNK